MQRNLRVRAAVNSAIRGAMERQGFVEVETPMLVPSTPEGAREFLVPSRQQPGSFYALPQSPQLFKQLLMVAGVDRYYQIARCLRDEDLRADRQYEFMQLDAEMSFVDQDDVLDAHQRGGARRRRGGRRASGRRAIERITWHEAMDRFGVDKPDLRFGMELVELTDVFAAHRVQGVRRRAGDQGHPRRRARPTTTAATSSTRSPTGPSRSGAKGLVWLKVGRRRRARVAGRQVPRPTTSRPRWSSALGAEPGDLLLIVADEWATTCEVLGQLRNDLGRPPVHEGPYRYVWVVDFPLFVGVDDDDGPPEARPPPVHPPASRRPRPARVRPDGGAQPGLRPRAQRLGARLGLDPDPRARAAAARSSTCSASATRRPTQRFGFFLNPFRYGAPPHGGFAFGIDRLVAILAGEENIREVIAFPKTQSGSDPMTNAPTPVDAKQLDDLGIRVLRRRSEVGGSRWRSPPRELNPQRIHS